jgi:Flp pilus assembly protein TadG
MGRVRQRLSRAGDERGAVLVMFAIFLPVLVLMSAFVLDVANWFVHKRHLQMQADAAALAAAAVWASPGCDDAAIEARARQYGGWSYNAQIGGTPSDKVHLVMNSRTYHGQTSPVDATVDPRPPCQAAMVDVKLTETDLPWFFEVAKVVPFINAHARVSILQADTLAGALPVGVPDPRPERAQVIFVDENDCASGTCRELGRRDLGQTGGAGSSTWDNSVDPFPLTMESTKVGIRVALTTTASGPMDCGAPLVDCFDAESTNGILRIRGWQDPGTVLPTQDPQARDVRLLNGTCTGAYFSTATASCTLAVEADIAFGSADPAAELGASVVASVGGNRTYTLDYDASTGLWRSDAEIPVAAGAGPVSISLTWRKTKGSSNAGACSNSSPCTGTFVDVHRAFAGSTARSGPVRGARAYEVVDPLVDANSFEMCATCTHDLVVELELTPSLQNASTVSDPPVVLRLTGSGSLTQALDCDPSKSRLEDEIATGCTPSYTKNTGTACPEHNVLWGTAQPWPCVKVDTGAPPNKIAAGLNLRVLGDEKAKICTSPNNWANFPNISPADPRIVQVFLTKFGSFSGSGMGTEPVTGFATFYVTGWRGSGGGFANPCVGQGDDSTPGDGYIMGHFIKYISTINTGTGTQPCNVNAFGTCIAVMSE